MSSDLRQGFRLGPWKIEPLLGAVTGPDGDSCHLEPKVMDVLVCLAEHPNELIGRDQLLDDVWSGHVAADELLTRAISELRHALHDARSNPMYIETIPKRGYRLIGEVLSPADIETEKNADSSKSFIHVNGRKMALITITVMALMFVYVDFGMFDIDHPQEEALTEAHPQVERVGVTDVWNKSIAVLPFVNISDDPANEYFSDGLSEEILNLLAKIPGLKTIGRTSSFSFKGKNEDLRVIGSTLGVETLLQGSVRKSNDKVRVVAQLINVSDGSQIWSETYERTITDIFAVQDDVAAAIIGALQIHVGAIPTRGRPTENAEAYTLLLKAKASSNDGEQAKAEKFALKAIELDPNFAEAYELLANVYWAYAGDQLEAADAQRRMGVTAAKALAIDPNLIYARLMYQLGNTETYTHLGEIEALERAARDAQDPRAMDQLIFGLIRDGYVQEALGYAMRLVDLEPLSSTANNRLFQTLFASGRTVEAIAALEVVDQLRPISTKWRFGIVDLIERHDESAIAHFETHLQSRRVSSNWVRGLVTGARDSASGQAHLDRRIPQIVASMREGAARDIQFSLTQFYLYFGYLDRYFEVISDHDLTGASWSDAEGLILFGTIYRRVGFTAHPKFLEVAESMGIIDIWEQRGPPDFCSKSSGKWVCE